MVTLSIYLSVSVCLSVCGNAWLANFDCVSVGTVDELTLSLSVGTLSVGLSVCLFVCLSVERLVNQLCLFSVMLG